MRFRAWIIVVLVCLSAATGFAAGPHRERALRLVEDVEQVRLLLGVTMWRTHDLRNAALYAGAPPHDTGAEAVDQENLRLYEALKPIDFAASSLFAAVDLNDAGDIEETEPFLRGELARVARQIQDQHAAVKAQLAAASAKLDAPPLSTLAVSQWPDPMRALQASQGATIGWRTNLEPADNFREKYWNDLQGLDIRYQLAKARDMGVDVITAKEPILRWDWIETADGQYDFARLDRAIDLVKSFGLKLKLTLPTMGGRVPDWWVTQHPDSVIRDEAGNADFILNPGTFAHDFMGPQDRSDGWYLTRTINLAHAPTRERYRQFVEKVAEHLRVSGGQEHVIAISADLFHAGGHWRVAPGADKRAAVLAHYTALHEITRVFAPIPVDMEVSDGEAHGISGDVTAHEWRSAGLTRVVDLPGVASETPFFEDLLRGVSKQVASERAGKPVDGPFFVQHCEYGFGTMLSVNFFTAMLRDGLWCDHWFGPEGPLRWGYFPGVFTWNDRQMQWSGITNGYLAYRQAHLLSPTLANTRIVSGDVAMLLPSSSFERPGWQAHRELVGWGWALTALKIQYDVITEESLARDGVPATARMLILPQVAVLDDKQAAAVRGFVENGGLLLCTYAPGNDGSKPSPLAEVIGCDAVVRDGKPAAAEQVGVKGTWLQITVPRGLHSGRYQHVPPLDEGYPRKFDTHPGNNAGRGWDAPFQVLAPSDGSNVVASYGNGEPAIVTHAFGNGRTLTMGYPYGNEILFADWTSVAFGKIYNGWARDRQMLEMVRWLRDALPAHLGYERKLSVPEGWRYRLQGFEAAVSSLSYPKGPPQREHFAYVQTYHDPRADHRLSLERDDMDYAAELTWRETPEANTAGTRFLSVGVRESAYSGERGSVHFWVMPHMFRVRIEDPAIKHVYDVAAGLPVKMLQRDDKGVSFITSVPPAMGRVFAVSTTDTVGLFEPATPRGLSYEEIERRVAAFVEREPIVKRSPGVVLGGDEIAAWLAGFKGKSLTICHGDAANEPAARALADWLKTRGIDATVDAADGEFWTNPKDGFQVTYRTGEAEILVGNAWSNNVIASLDAQWAYNNGDAPATAPGKLSATYAWPILGDGVVTLTRRMDLRKEDHTPSGLTYGDLRGLAPRDVDTAPKASQRRRLLVLASTPEGALAAVRALESVRAKPTD